MQTCTIKVKDITFSVQRTHLDFGDFAFDRVLVFTSGTDILAGYMDIDHNNKSVDLYRNHAFLRDRDDWVETTLKYDDIVKLNDENLAETIIDGTF